jgi:hypothetical protein
MTFDLVDDANVDAVRSDDFHMLCHVTDIDHVISPKALPPNARQAKRMQSAPWLIVAIIMPIKMR